MIKGLRFNYKVRGLDANYKVYKACGLDATATSSRLHHTGRAGRFVVSSLRYV